jgi:CheY-like chemotaxis protein
MVSALELTATSRRRPESHRESNQVRFSRGLEETSHESRPARLRPIFLVTDPPDPETLSTRKLVIETAKFNVLTAFTSQEAIETIERVPITAAVLHENLDGATLAETILKIKRICPDLPVFVVMPNPHPMTNVDQAFSSFNPMELVEYLLDRFGKPDKNGNLIPMPRRINQR